MTLRIDASTEAKLREADGVVEVRDEEGKLLGYFAAINPRQAPLYEPAQDNQESVSSESTSNQN